MANKVLQRVWDHSQQRGAARCLVLAIADVADADGIAYPGVAYLAKMICEDEDYTFRLLRKVIATGELLHKPGGGRGRKTLYAVACGLSDTQIERLNTVLQYRVSGDKNPVPTSREKKNPGLQNTVISDAKPWTLSDSKQASFDASEPPKLPINGKLIHDHDPTHDDGGGARALEKYLSELPMYPQTVTQILALDLDPPTVIAACDMLRAAGWGIGAIADHIRKYPPVKGQPYVNPDPPRSVQSNDAPDRRKPSERIGERPTLPKGLKFAGRKAAD